MGIGSQSLFSIKRKCKCSLVADQDPTKGLKFVDRVLRCGLSRALSSSLERHPPLTVAPADPTQRLAEKHPRRASGTSALEP